MGIRFEMGSWRFGIGFEWPDLGFLFSFLFVLCYLSVRVIERYVDWCVKMSFRQGMLNKRQCEVKAAETAISLRRPNGFPIFENKTIRDIEQFYYATAKNPLLRSTESEGEDLCVLKRKENLGFLQVSLTPSSSPLKNPNPRLSN